MALALSVKKFEVVTVQCKCGCLTFLSPVRLGSDTVRLAFEAGKDTIIMRERAETKPLRPKEEGAP